jgi:hypothetical protein
MAAENCLCGAPRIHGELLKLGIAVSERTHATRTAFSARTAARSGVYPLRLSVFRACELRGNRGAQALRFAHVDRSPVDENRWYGRHTLRGGFLDVGSR